MARSSSAIPIGGWTSVAQTPFQSRLVESGSSPDPVGALLFQSAQVSNGQLPLSRTLRFGCSGEAVLLAQSMLNGQPPSTLAPLAIDGFFGRHTRARVIEYQGNNRLYADGEVGTSTWGMLKSKVRLVPTSNQFGSGVVGRSQPASFAPLSAKVMTSFLSQVDPGRSTITNITLPPIDATPTMPALPPLTVQIDGISPDPTPTTAFDWSLDVVFDESSCTCGKAGVSFRDGFVLRSVGGAFPFSGWPWIRGGVLTIAARAEVFGELTETIFVGAIEATDPPTSAVRAELGDVIMRKIANVESGFHQFEPDPTTGKVVPKFNKKNGPTKPGDGGAGICQITPPSADDIWNWKANVRKGKAIFAGARAAAKAFLSTHNKNGQFTNSLGLTNEEAVLREAIQNFNGGHFWQFNLATNQWEEDPKKNNYVNLVLGASA